MTEFPVDVECHHKSTEAPLARGGKGEFGERRSREGRSADLRDHAEKHFAANIMLKRVRSQATDATAG
eukprot:4522113-Pyramimonas_sp.AAC.1